MMADRNNFRVKRWSWSKEIKQGNWHVPHVCIIAIFSVKGLNLLTQLCGIYSDSFVFCLHKWDNLSFWVFSLWENIFLYFGWTEPLAVQPTTMQTLASLPEINVVQPAIDHLRIIVCRCTGSQCSSSPCRCNLSMRPRPRPRAPTMFWLIVPVSLGHLGLHVVLHITHICPNKGAHSQQCTGTRRCVHYKYTWSHTETHRRGH